MAKLRSNRNKLYDLSKEEFDKIKKDIENNNTYKSFLEYAKSKNSDDNILINKDTKLIIVGSITPSKGRDFYYTSDDNKMYEILDNNLKGTDLKNNKNNKDYLINTLKDNHIAFIDVFSEVIRIKDSSSDEHIYFGVIEKDLSKYFAKAPNAAVVSNSRLVKSLLISRNIKSDYHTIFSWKNNKNYIDQKIKDDWNDYLEKWRSKYGIKY